MFDDLCNVHYGAIVGWNVSMGREEEVAAGMALGVRLTEVAGVTVCRKYHVAGVVRDDGIFLCFKVV